MDGGLMNDPEMDMMYENALQALYAGNVMPFDRQILSRSPLPNDAVDPFSEQDVDPKEIMQFAYKSLSAWIDEAKKACYFTKHFTNLSRLILKGVNTMGRGLMTLHNRGEDLSQAPMQIGDLISVASYHFRKSYLGVMQISAADPETGERLLINQLSWTNMLLRLYRTKEKLETAVRKQPSAVSIDSGKLSAAEASSPALPSSVDHTAAFPDAAALSGPAAISAPRALSSFDSRKKTAERGPEKQPRELASKAVKQVSETESTPEQRVKNKNAENPETGIQKPDPSEKETIPENESNYSETREPEAQNENSASGEEIPESSPEQTEASNDDPVPDDLPPEAEDDLPPYQKILENVFARGEAPESGGITFTEYEMLFLAADPDFNRCYPETAAEFRRILEEYDST